MRDTWRTAWTEERDKGEIREGGEGEGRERRGRVEEEEREKGEVERERELKGQIRGDNICSLAKPFSHSQSPFSTTN